MEDEYEEGESNQQDADKQFAVLSSKVIVGVLGPKMAADYVNNYLDNVKELKARDRVRNVLAIIATASQSSTSK